MTDINLRTGFFLSREVGRHMRDNKIKGRILLITSQHRETPRNLPHYSASKAGMTMVMKELARMLAPDGIRVNAIAPGAIPGGGFVADNLGALVAQIPIGRRRHARRHRPGRCRGPVRKIWSLCRGHDGRS